MKIYASSLDLLQSRHSNPVTQQGLHMIVGNFDGLHLGHQALLAQAQSFQKSLGGDLGVYSFDPHPQAFFRPQSEHIYLEKRSVWRNRLFQVGVEILIEEKFTKEFAALSAEAFLKKYWAPELGLKSLTVGTDFRFGQGRKGDHELLKSWCRERGIAFFAVEPVLMDGQRVSTTKIKEFLSAGSIVMANRFLGRPFSISGIVTKGEQRGRLLGFPTVNLMESSAVLLKRGVYRTRVSWKGQKLQAVTNVGVRPTLHVSSPVVVESHLLHAFAQDLYQQEIEVEFLDFLRGEKKFSNLEELRIQIQADVKQAESGDWE